MTPRKATLLIVVDEPVTRELLSQVFARCGHKVSSANDGFTALEQIRAEPPDIILSDLNMPGMSGFELLSVLRRRIPGIYVIATSGAFAGERVPHGIAADAYYAKATGLTHLFEIMQNASQPDTASRDRNSAATPIWISPTERDASLRAQVLISCLECWGAFSLRVEAADFLIHETPCVYCGADFLRDRPPNESGVAAAISLQRRVCTGLSDPARPLCRLRRLAVQPGPISSRLLN